MFHNRCLVLGYMIAKTIILNVCERIKMNLKVQQRIFEFFLRLELVTSAVQSAKQALVTWSVSSAERRSHLLHCIADKLESRAEEFAIAESRDTGKPAFLTRNFDIPRALAMLRYNGAAYMAHTGKNGIYYKEHV